MFKVFGKNPPTNFLGYSHFQYYKNSTFQNIAFTPVMEEGVKPWHFIRDAFNRPKFGKPVVPLPVDLPTTQEVNTIATEPSYTWWGHSSYTLEINGKTIVVDPVMSPNASPIAGMVTAFKGPDAFNVQHLPQHIDVLVLTHDHYDHLDYKTVVAIKDRVGTVVCSAGVGSHLKYWGYNATIIHELLWGESISFANMHFHAVPARHFSGRTFKRGTTLWSAFVLQYQGLQWFIGGDSGYGEHFNSVTKQFGAMDYAWLECGQYHKLWTKIHMHPTETALAAQDLGLKTFTPVHWGKFSLAFHNWFEPPQLVTAAALSLGIQANISKMGKKVAIFQPSNNERWWE